MNWLYVIIFYKPASGKHDFTSENISKYLPEFSENAATSKNDSVSDQYSLG